MAKIIPFEKPHPHILIVEDDKNTLDVFVEFIQMKITNRVSGVFNAWSAIEYLNSHGRVDLVVTDVNMGFVDYDVNDYEALREQVRGMDGIELTGIIRRNWNIPVIVMTGYPTEDYIARAKLAGASKFFFKPVPLKDLETAINKVLNNESQAWLQTGGRSVIK